jgi:hypothetical protein
MLSLGGRSWSKEPERADDPRVSSERPIGNLQARTVGLSKGKQASKQAQGLTRGRYFFAVSLSLSAELGATCAEAGADAVPDCHRKTSVRMDLE